VTVAPLHHVRALAATWRGRFILAFVALQLALPLRYYVAHRDPHDERFAWRMFSPIRMARCTPAFAVDGKPVNLGNEFHEAWIELAQRGRFAVVEAMASRLCSASSQPKVSVSLACSYVDGTNHTWSDVDLCAKPEL
jgi:hypothetical protein